MSPRLDEAKLTQLALVAGLDLDPERRRAVLAQLADLLADADRVNGFMADRRDVVPAIRFDAMEARDGN
jgi:hypothetical protein